MAGSAHARRPRRIGEGLCGGPIREKYGNVWFCFID